MVPIKLFPSMTKHQQQFLTNLEFEGMDYRRCTIDHAPINAFDWIFYGEHEDKPLYFRPWLTSKQGVFWIAGKPGSGKSTLMKRIVEARTTSHDLANWAGSSRLVVASFYFWYAGSSLQKSLEGLLRSILYQILRQCPELIPSEAQLLQTGVGLETLDWSHRPLTQLLEETIKSAIDKTCFCFFIDGLDEYEGEPRDVLFATRHLARLPNVKLCISSRPWNEFFNEFGSDRTKMLELHEHTGPEIRKYISNKLERYSFPLEDSESPNIVQEMVNDADGVFLWVLLVFRDLQSFLPQRPSAKEVIERIRQMPSDLHQFYLWKLKSIPQGLQREVYRILLLRLQATRPLLVLAPEFIANNYQADVEGNASQSVDPGLSEGDGRWDQGRIKQATLNVLGKRRSQFQDLIQEVESRSDSWIDRYSFDFVHSTVHEYLWSPSVMRHLKLGAGLTFDVDRALLRTSIGLLRLCLSAEQDGSSRKAAMKVVHDLAFYARRFENNNKNSQFASLNDVQDIMSKFHYEDADPWTHIDSFNTPIKRALHNSGKLQFCAFAVRWGLCHYVERLKAEDGLMVDLDNMAGYSGLYLALLHPLSCPGEDHGIRDIHIGMVRTLLQLRARPNLAYGEKTVYMHFLAKVDKVANSDLPPRLRATLLDIIKLLIFHGAYVDAENNGFLHQVVKKLCGSNVTDSPGYMARFVDFLSEVPNRIEWRSYLERTYTRVSSALQTGSTGSEYQPVDVISEEVEEQWVLLE